MPIFINFNIIYSLIWAELPKINITVILNVRNTELSLFLDTLKTKENFIILFNKTKAARFRWNLRYHWPLSGAAKEDILIHMEISIDPAIRSSHSNDTVLAEYSVLNNVKSYVFLLELR